MSDQFHRTRLLLGEVAFERLRTAHITVVGCGAVGSFAIEALARTGVGRLTLVDGDTVEESNINRQLCALHSTIGQPKTEVLKKRIADICPETVVQAKTAFLDSGNCADLIPVDTNWIVDAIDTVSGKIPLILHAQKKKIPIISSMGAAMKTDLSCVKVAPLNQTKYCPLAARVRKLLREKGADLSLPCVFSIEPPAGNRQPDRQMGSLITLTGSFGLALANEVIKRITDV